MDQISGPNRSTSAAQARSSPVLAAAIRSVISREPHPWRAAGRGRSPAVCLSSDHLVLPVASGPTEIRPAAVFPRWMAGRLITTRMDPQDESQDHAGDERPVSRRLASQKMVRAGVRGYACVTSSPAAPDGRRHGMRSAERRQNGRTGCAGICRAAAAAASRGPANARGAGRGRRTLARGRSVTWSAASTVPPARTPPSCWPRPGPDRDRAGAVRGGGPWARQPGRRGSGRRGSRQTGRGRPGGARRPPTTLVPRTLCGSTPRSAALRGP